MACIFCSAIADDHFTRNFRSRESNHSLKPKVITVWRAFFFAVGTMLIIVGIECLLIDSATLSGGEIKAAQVSNAWFGPQQTMAVDPQRIVQPPEWIVWTSIASGAVVLLYAFTLPRRWGGEG